MTCGQVQTNLSLYLYGELEFALEDAVEEHLAGCALCQLAFKREKSLHAALNARDASVPYELLAQCRGQLHATVQRQTERPTKLTPRPRVWDGYRMEIWESAWPTRVAAALLLLTVGFGAGRWQAVRMGTEAGVLQPYTRVRGIQPVESGRVRLVVDRVQEGELTGSLSDDSVRRLILTATKDSSDPAIRVDSVQLLNGQTGDDVRDALLASVQQDRNSAVRLKALEGLRSFASDTTTRRVLVQMLQNDDNPGVRSEAIDVLLPASRRFTVTADLLQTLDQLARTGGEDDYVRSRCLQVLRSVNNTAEVY